jgi:uncharacterized protein YjbJ (UPF0337 family)
MAVAAGYLLGRRKKTRLAFMLGAAALTGGLSGVTGQLMRSGTKVLGSGDGLTDGLGKAAGDALGKAAGEAVPGLGEVGDMIRQDLTSVAKRAVATAVSNQIESLSDQLHDRAEAIREQSAGSVKEKGGAPPEDEAEDDGEGRPAQRRRVPRQRGAGNGRAESRRDEPVEAEDEEPAEAEDEEPAERAPRSSAASRGGAALRSGARAGRSAQASSPIRRTRR